LLRVSVRESVVMVAVLGPLGELGERGRWTVCFGVWLVPVKVSGGWALVGMAELVEKGRRDGAVDTGESRKISGG
jgi:hypothetical protein